MADFITPKQSGLAAWMVKHGKKAMINPANGNLVINRMTGITPTEKIKGMSTPTKGWFESELDMTRKVFELDTGVTKTAYQAQQAGWYVIALGMEHYMSKDGKSWVKGETDITTGNLYYLAGRTNGSWYLFAGTYNSTSIPILKSNDFKVWSLYNSQINDIPLNLQAICQNDNTICLVSLSAGGTNPLYSTVVSTFQGDTETKRQYIGSEALAATIAATSFVYDSSYTQPVGIAWNGKVFCCIVLAVTYKGATVAVCFGYFSYTSSDGVNWQFNPTPIIQIANYFTPFSGPIPQIINIAATKGLFCLTGYNAGYSSWFDSYTSKDGKTWSGPFTISHNDISVVNGVNGLTASNDTFCLLGDAGSSTYSSGFQTRCMTSNDGKTWQASSLFGDNTGSSIGSNGDSFVATSSWEGVTRYYYSKTGMGWERLPINPTTQAGNINSYFSRR